jgi:SET domain-containing protein
VNPELSNQARWMNHASGNAVNVEWKKQRLGAHPAMHFYASAAIKEGDELCFDYGDEYWAPLGETPV